MHAPPLVGWLLVLLCAAAGTYCLSRSRTGTAVQRREAGGEALMGLGMAVMAAPVGAITAAAWWPWPFTAVFAAAGIWALVRRHPHHAVGALAMIHMALAMGPLSPAAAASQGHTAHGTAGGASSGLPVLTGLLLAYYAVFVIAAGIRLAPAAALAHGPVTAGRPELVGGCRVAMGIAMFAMLLTM